MLDPSRWEEKKKTVFANMVPKSPLEKVSGCWRKLRNETMHDLYSSLNFERWSQTVSDERGMWHEW